VPVGLSAIRAAPMLLKLEFVLTTARTWFNGCQNPDVERGFVVWASSCELRGLVVASCELLLGGEGIIFQ
jgi:hypothetical protein